MTAEERKALKTEKGVLVSEVKAFGEAAERSIGRNDVILEADRKLVTTPGDLKKIIGEHKSGDSVLLRIKRDETTAFVAIQVP
jgi:serine protease Do